MKKCIALFLLFPIMGCSYPIISTKDIEKDISRKTPDHLEISKTFPYSEKKIIGSIENSFSSLMVEKKFPQGSKFKDLSLMGRSYIPDDSWLDNFTYVKGDLCAHYAMNGVERNPDMKSYLSIPLDKRKNDFYLSNFSNMAAWTSSEYFYKGVPAQFHTEFIIHIEPVNKDHTTVQVFEYQPMVYLKPPIGIIARQCFFPVYRYVSPSRTEKAEILQIIQSQLP